MTKFAVEFILIIFFTATQFSQSKGQPKLQEKSFSEPQNGLAVILTGATARFPQEADLLEELDKRGLLKTIFAYYTMGRHSRSVTSWGISNP